MSRRWRYPRSRRGRFLAAPLAAASVAPAWRPGVVRMRVRLAALRPGTVFAPPWPAQSPVPPPAWVPPRLTRRRSWAFGRRGQFTTSPPPVATIPMRPPSRRLVVRGRRAAIVTPPWPQATPPPPPAFVPCVMRGRAGQPARRTPGRIWPGWMELTVSPEPESSRGLMAFRERAGEEAAHQDRASSDAHGVARRGAQMSPAARNGASLGGSG